MSHVSTAELAIYAILILPTLYILIKHGPPGYLGWFYVIIFFSLRIIGGAMSLNGSSSASIVANIGLSPLLLAAAGILHEARVCRNRELDPKIEWIKVVLYHIHVTGGVALLAVGASHLQGDNPAPSDMTLVKVGLAILTVAWVILAGWAGISLRPLATLNGPNPQRAGAILLYSVLFSVIFIGIRVIYSLVAMTSGHASINPNTASLAIQVLLQFLPELIAALSFIAAGAYTRNVRHAANAEAGRGQRAHDSELKGWKRTSNVV
ncbi:hypothetical protein G7Z17_g4480 [Cylindrodendrum hubeiense]|uniref:DUF7702 domain-containing protein n=1 Tax=Cylindrodendrum hubeiense TaxID=595255 RepID=A0A9P5HGU5_9HYPO|nr:hypothetical protein G7Z17_g4480 [Cylindrodendrum hubeiense]